MMPSTKSKTLLSMTRSETASPPCSAACTPPAQPLARKAIAWTARHGYSVCSLAALAHAASIVVAASLVAPILGARAIARRMRCTRDLPCAVPMVVVALLRRNGNDAQQLRLPQRTQGSVAANAKEHASRHVPFTAMAAPSPAPHSTCATSMSAGNPVIC